MLTGHLDVYKPFCLCLRCLLFYLPVDWVYSRSKLSVLDLSSVCNQALCLISISAALPHRSAATRWSASVTGTTRGRTAASSTPSPSRRSQLARRRKVHKAAPQTACVSLFCLPLIPPHPPLIVSTHHHRSFFMFQSRAQARRVVHLLWDSKHRYLTVFLFLLRVGLNVGRVGVCWDTFIHKSICACTEC